MYCPNVGILYIVQEREFIRLNEPTYKIGRTKIDSDKILNNYSRGSKLCFKNKVKNHQDFEKYLISKFKKKFEHKKVYGNKYFSGDLKKMKKVIRKGMGEF